jgi:hypothetical protein
MNKLEMGRGSDLSFHLCTYSEAKHDLGLDVEPT